MMESTAPIDATLVPKKKRSASAKGRTSDINSEFSDDVQKDRNARELRGEVVHILWSSVDVPPFVIAKLRSKEVVKGIMAEDDLIIGGVYRFLGRWENNRRYGDRFAFQTYMRDRPHDECGVVKYLQAFAPHVGRSKATKLWDAFGSDAVQVLRTQPERVVELGILNEVAAQEAAEALQRESNRENTKIDLYGLFAGRGFSSKLLAACMDRWGARAAQRIRLDPLTLLVNEMPGCGFRRCNRLYLDLGRSPDRLKRQMLCAWNALREDTVGHTWFRIGVAVEAIEHNITGVKRNPVKAIKLGVRARWLATRRSPQPILWVAEECKARREQIVADRIRALRSWPECLWPSISMSLLSEHQYTTIRRALVEPVAILAGSAGTGKTRSAAAIIQQIVAEHGEDSVAICAPTGKAAVRLTSALQGYGLNLQATTIHRLLEVTRTDEGWGFQHNRYNPLNKRFVFLDEASMLPTDLAADLFSACQDGTHILLIGDPYQLPPVGHGAPLRDLMAAGIPCGELTAIHRNAGLIVQACSAIKNGKRFDTADRFDAENGLNLRHIECGTPKESMDALRAVLRRFRESGKFNPVWDVQVLVAVNQKSVLSRMEVNRVLQAELNADGLRKEPNPFRVGDKVICLKNGLMPLMSLKDDGDPTDVASYEASADSFGSAPEAFLANGEIGRVLAVDPEITIAQFSLPDRIVKIIMSRKKDEGADGPESQATDFDLAYAITGHKSQGSEWPVAIVLIDPQAGFVASREHVYTTISRASKLCILIGQRLVIDRQCRRVALGQRKTFLAELLREASKQAATATCDIR